MKKVYYSSVDFEIDVKKLADIILKQDRSRSYTGIYGVPKGGVPLAVGLAPLLKLPVVDVLDWGDWTLVVDDIVSSGKTRNLFPNNDFYALHIDTCAKIDSDIEKISSGLNLINENIWIEYFWEMNEAPAEDSVFRIIESIGEDVNREGLKDTPARVIKSYKHLFSGYDIDPKSLIKTFDGETYDQVVLLKDIEMYSTCEHHMLPFIGKAHIAYLPNKRVIGVSKLARILEVFSRRLQIQERIGEQVTGLLMSELKAKAAACIIEAKHLCMQMRGVEKQNSVLTTSSLKGLFLTSPSSRSELLQLIK